VGSSGGAYSFLQSLSCLQSSLLPGEDSLDDLTRGREGGTQYGTQFRTYLSYLANTGEIPDKSKSEQKLSTEN